MTLVDSDILIAHLRGHEAARDWLAATRRTTGRLAISVVTVVEVAGGMRSPERREVARLLGTFRVFPVTERVAWTAAGYTRTLRAAHGGIGLGDFLVAATALVEGLELATLNVRHYPMFEGLTAPFAA